MSLYASAKKIGIISSRPGPRMPTLLKVLMVVVFVAGMTTLIVVVTSHPGTGPVLCNPAVCTWNPDYTPSALSSPEPLSTVSSQSLPTALPTTGPDAWWRTVNACHLLTETEERGIGVTGAAHAVPGQQSECAWGQWPRPDVTVVLTQYPYTLLSPSYAQKVRTSDGRPGVMTEVAGDSSRCEVALQATKGSTVTVVVMGGSHARQCQAATKAANVISPELPRSGITR
jgi:Protein of unknown function (DUF3558)